MTIEFLGTSAAAGCPAIHCTCDACTEIRRRGGKDIRTRSSIRIGSECQVDFGPDVHWQLLRAGLTMSTIRHLLFTHSHPDHLNVPDLLRRHLNSERPTPTLHVYANETTISALDAVAREAGSPRARRGRDGDPPLYDVVALPFGGARPVGDLRVTAVPANHRVAPRDETASSYFIELPSGASVLYAVDTGWPSDDAIAMLAGRRVGILIMDCTFGGMPDRPRYPNDHLDADSFVRAVDLLTERDVITADARVFASHVGPHQGLLHEELEKRLRRGSPRMAVAYDGLRIDI